MNNIDIAYFITSMSIGINILLVNWFIIIPKFERFLDKHGVR